MLYFVKTNIPKRQVSTVNLKVKNLSVVKQELRVKNAEKILQIQSCNVHHKTQE